MPELPPFAGKTQSLTKADLVEIIRYGVPKKWQQQLKLQGFATSKQTFKELVKFMEAQEQAEEEYTPQPNKNKSKKLEWKGDNGGKWCAIHKSHSHNTEDCHDNKEKNKNNKHYKNNSNNKHGNHGNKSWSLQAEENKKFTQAELNALVAKEVKKAKPNWTSQQKKHKDSNDKPIW